MSTHASTHDSTASPRPTTTDTRPESERRTPTPPETETPDTDASWVARCQSQFDTGSRDRLGNLADDENEYVRGSH